MRRLVSALAAMLLFLPGPGGAGEVSGTARLIDGDTIEISGERVRLHGIDAPESGQSCSDGNGAEWPCGREATEALRRIVAGRPVTCRGAVRDGHGRLIAVCRTAEGEINSRMVRAGMAVPFTRYSDDYLDAGIEAQKAGRGLHAGTFQLPEEFRAQIWQAGVDECPAGCPIKGNVSSRGRIYHMPWSRHYDRTRIDAAKGERCFCSEREALDAGWRAPYR